MNSRGSDSIEISLHVRGDCDKYGRTALMGHNKCLSAAKALSTAARPVIIYIIFTGHFAAKSFSQILRECIRQFVIIHYVHHGVSFSLKRSYTLQIRNDFLCHALAKKFVFKLFAS